MFDDLIRAISIKQKELKPQFFYWVVEAYASLGSQKGGKLIHPEFLDLFSIESSHVKQAKDFVMDLLRTDKVGIEDTMSLCVGVNTANIGMNFSSLAVMAYSFMQNNRAPVFEKKYRRSIYRIPPTIQKILLQKKADFDKLLNALSVAINGCLHLNATKTHILLIKYGRSEFSLKQAKRYLQILFFSLEHTNIKQIRIVLNQQLLALCQFFLFMIIGQDRNEVFSGFSQDACHIFSKCLNLGLPLNRVEDYLRDKAMERECEGFMRFLDRPLINSYSSSYSELYSESQSVHEKRIIDIVMRKLGSLSLSQQVGLLAYIDRNENDLGVQSADLGVQSADLALSIYKGTPQWMMCAWSACFMVNYAIKHNLQDELSKMYRSKKDNEYNWRDVKNRLSDLEFEQKIKFIIKKPYCCFKDPSVKLVPLKDSIYISNDREDKVPLFAISSV